MSKSIETFRCLIISPSDVSDERDAVHRVIHSWNAHSGPQFDVRVEPVAWETHARPELGSRPQAVLNRQLVDECDFGIAIFWCRFGSPTGEHESGSIEEIERLLAKGADVMVYFCDRDAPQSLLQNDQYQKLQEIKKRYRDRGILATYTEVSDLEKLVLLHLSSQMAQLLLAKRAHGQPIPSAGTMTAPRPDVRIHVAAAFAAPQGEDLIHLVTIEIQNHSPVPFYFGGVTLRLENARQLAIMRDGIFNQPLTSREIASGDRFDVHLLPHALIRDTNGEIPTVAIVKDKIGREFRSKEGSLVAAFKQALER